MKVKGKREKEKRTVERVHFDTAIYSPSPPPKEDHLPLDKIPPAYHPAGNGI
jgi:hypothetical protein